MVPAQEGLWGGDCGNPLQACAAEWVGQRREAAFGVGQAQLATPELGFKDAILFQPEEPSHALQNPARHVHR